LSVGSEGPSIVESMFDLEALAAVNPHADEAALIEQIAWLERKVTVEVAPTLTAAAVTPSSPVVSSMYPSHRAGRTSTCAGSVRELPDDPPVPLPSREG
jgi:hypothetical protein